MIGKILKFASATKKLSKKIVSKDNRIVIAIIIVLFISN